MIQQFTQSNPMHNGNRHSKFSINNDWNVMLSQSNSISVIEQSAKLQDIEVSYQDFFLVLISLYPNDGIYPFKKQLHSVDSISF